MPALDVLQTVPAFAYLIPILLLFGFGTTVGLVASVIFAFPPMVRNTICGLRAVPDSIVESGQMSGANAWQLFWQVRTPSALRQILLGVNQATMASLSMVIVASIIGGTSDIGWEVIRTMRKAQFGESTLAGIVIAMIAMIMDRITSGLALKSGRSFSGEEDKIKSRKLSMMLVFIAIAITLLAQEIPFLAGWPEGYVFDVAPAINQAVGDFIAEYNAQIRSVKNTIFFFAMLPIKSGMETVVTPYS